MATVTIDGKQFELDKLSKKAKQHLALLQVAERRIRALTEEVMLARAARSASSEALRSELKLPAPKAK